MWLPGAGGSFWCNAPASDAAILDQPKVQSQCKLQTPQVHYEISHRTSGRMNNAARIIAAPVATFNTEEEGSPSHSSIIFLRLSNFLAIARPSK